MQCRLNTRLPSHLITRKCHVTKITVTSCDPPWPKKPMLHANTALSSIERELLPTEVLHCGNREFHVFWLLPWPLPDDLHIRTWPVSTEDVNELSMSKLLKVIVLHTQMPPKLLPYRFAGVKNIPTTEASSYIDYKLLLIWAQIIEMHFGAVGDWWCLRLDMHTSNILKTVN